MPHKLLIKIHVVYEQKLQNNKLLVALLANVNWP
jgi:hypothetical protein